MNSQTRRYFLRGGASFGAASFILPLKAQEDTFRGKTIRIVVGAQAGQSYDLAARTVAAHIKKYLPGSPNIIVENMPGAGSLTMTNYVYNSGVRDGTLIGLPLSSILLEPSLNLTSRAGGQVRFDLSKINWIGTPVQDPPVLLVSKHKGIRRFAQLQETQITVGTSGAGSDNALVATLCNNLLGAKLRIVAGYGGVSDLMLAVDRGEIDGFATGYSALPVARPQWLSEGSVVLLAQFGLKRISQLPDVPTAIELADTDDSKEMLKIYGRKFNAAYPFMLPPDMAVERVDLIRSAFSKVLLDSDFQEQFSKSRMVLDPAMGPEIERLIKSTNEAPERLIQTLKDMLSLR